MTITLPLCRIANSELPSGNGLFVGTYTKPGEPGGIYHATFRPSDGTFGAVSLAAEIPSPSYLSLSPKGDYLYAVSEGSDGRVGAFAVGSDGRLTPLNVKPSGGAAPCHLSLDKSGERLFIANYRSGSISLFSLLEGGVLGEMDAIWEFKGSGPNPTRQLQPHAHWVGVGPTGRFLYACDLGTDKIWIFRLSPPEAKSPPLTPAEPPWASVSPGGGPRHLAFHPSGKFAFVNSEMGMAVNAFALDPETGALEKIATASTLPEGHPSDGATSAAIVCHPNGRFLYVSNRGTDTLAAFSISAQGALTLIQHVAAEVATPREIALVDEGRWLLVAGQADGRIVSRNISPESGLIGPVRDAIEVPSPVCILAR